MRPMGWILVVFGLMLLIILWPLGLLMIAGGVFMISSAGREDRRALRETRMLAELQAQREAIRRESGAPMQPEDFRR